MIVVVFGNGNIYHRGESRKPGTREENIPQSKEWFKNSSPLCVHSASSSSQVPPSTVHYHFAKWPLFASQNAAKSLSFEWR